MLRVTRWEALGLRSATVRFVYYFGDRARRARNPRVIAASRAGGASRYGWYRNSEYVLGLSSSGGVYEERCSQQSLRSRRVRSTDDAASRRLSAGPGTRTAGGVELPSYDVSRWRLRFVSPGERRWRTAVSTRNKNITYLGLTETVSLASRRRVARTAQRAGPRGRDRTAVITADKIKEIRPLVPGGAARCAADPHPAPHGAGETGRGSAPRGRERSREQPRALDEHLFSITHVAGYSSLSL